MKLEDLLDVLEPCLEFELYSDGHRVGIFTCDDKGLEDYRNAIIEELEVENKRLIVNLG